MEGSYPQQIAEHTTAEHTITTTATVSKTIDEVTSRINEN